MKPLPIPDIILLTDEMSNPSERKVNLFDVDNTLTQGYIIFDIIASQAHEGILPEKYNQIIRASLVSYSSRSLSYEALVRTVLINWAEGLSQTPVKLAQNHIGLWIENNPQKFHPYALEVFGLLKEHSNFLVTAQPDFVAHALAERLDATGYLSTRFTTQNGYFTGEAHVLASAQDKAQKLSYLQDLYGDFEIFIALGDSGSDSDFLAQARHPICINPNPELYALAKARNWAQSDGSDVLSMIRSRLALLN